MSEDTSTRGGITAVEALLVLFIALKLTGHITWSWWWVLSPLWVPICCSIVLAFISGIAAGIAKYCETKASEK